MSADNTIVVGCFIGKNSPIYHVAHIQALENYDYFIEREEWENLDEWLFYYFSKSPPFTNKDGAWKYARQIHD